MVVSEQHYFLFWALPQLMLCWLSHLIWNWIHHLDNDTDSFFYRRDLLIIEWAIRSSPWRFQTRRCRRRKEWTWFNCGWFKTSINHILSEMFERSKGSLESPHIFLFNFKTQSPLLLLQTIRISIKTSIFNASWGKAWSKSIDTPRNFPMIQKANTRRIVNQETIGDNFY